MLNYVCCHVQQILWDTLKSPRNQSLHNDFAFTKGVWLLLSCNPVKRIINEKCIIRFTGIIFNLKLQLTLKCKRPSKLRLQWAWLKSSLRRCDLTWMNDNPLINLNQFLKPKMFSLLTQNTPLIFIFFSTAAYYSDCVCVSPVMPVFGKLVKSVICVLVFLGVSLRD